MLKRKIKIKFNDEELRIILYALNDFRNELLNEHKDVSADIVGEMMTKVKNKIKVDKYDLGIIINGLDKERKIMLSENKDTHTIDELLLRLIKIDETLKK